MLSMRAYVPSRMLLRALSRPSPPKCHLVRAAPLQYSFARTKATKSKTSAQSKSAPKKNAAHKEPPLQGYDDNDPDFPVIEFYERDLDKGGPDLLTKRIATPEDRAKERRIWKMYEEDMVNPDYDDAELKRALVDEMVADPRFKEVADVLKDMKTRIRSKEEAKKELEQVLKAQQEVEELEDLELQASLKTVGADELLELCEDPNFKDLRPHFLEFREKLTRFDNNLEHPEVMKIMDKLEEELSKRPHLVDEVDEVDESDSIESVMKNFVEPGDEEERLEDPEDVEFDDQLLFKMKDLMAAMGGDKSVEAEIDELLKEKVDPDELEKDEEDDIVEFNYETLSAEISRLNKEPKPPTDPEEEEMGPDLKAKIDNILTDPNLLEKLSRLQNSVEKAKERKAAGLTTVPHEMAPDPEKLPADRTTGLQQRMEVARNDPEHAAALTKLHVDLPPPFHISPAVKSFNQAIELAYLGANDDIRRILWRAYVKVRTLPTFLQNVSDDTWDLMYYSQAVTWASNQNREDHLRLLLHDLASVGLDGPPTHPSTFVEG